MKTIKIILFLVGALSFSTAFSQQCKSFVKNKCRAAMGDYIPGENFNSAKLMAGDEAELEMTFHSGEDYRLLICSHPALGQVGFQILDSEGTVLFDNMDHDNTDHFDFRVAGTKNFLIKLKAPPSNKSISPQGCVAIMVGRKFAE